jgi:hypothetical protein
LYTCDNGWQVLEPSLSTLTELDPDVLGDVCTQLKIAVFQDSVGSSPEDGYVTAGVLADEILECLCDAVAVDPEIADTALVCGPDGFVEHPIGTPCDYVIEDTENPATAVLQCVEDELLQRPLPSFCDSVVVSMDPATVAISCDAGVTASHPIDICALIDAAGAEAVQDCLGLIANSAVEVGPGDSGHLTVTPVVDGGTGQITYQIEGDLLSACEQSDVPGATILDATSIKVTACVTDSLGGETEGLVSLSDGNIIPPLPDQYTCIPQVESQDPDGPGPADGDSPIRRDCEGALWVWLCTEESWETVTPSVDGLATLDPENIVDLCNDTQFLAWYQNGDCVTKRQVALGDLSTYLQECICDTIAPDATPATEAMVCVDGLFVNRPIETVCEQFTDDPGTPTDTALVCVDGELLQRPIAGVGAVISSATLETTTYAAGASGSHVFNVDTQYAIVELTGGGAAGGGAIATGAFEGAVGSGGSGGSYLRMLYTAADIATLTGSAAYSVAGNVSGVAGAAGTDGEDTEFDDATAEGGGGGAVSAIYNSSPPAFSGGFSSVGVGTIIEGAEGGRGEGGIVFPSNPPSTTTTTSATTTTSTSTTTTTSPSTLDTFATMLSGNGGASHIAPGAPGHKTTASADGIDSFQPGAGGSGAVNAELSAARPGGGGGGGRITVYEYVFS